MNMTCLWKFSAIQVILKKKSGGQDIQTSYFGLSNL